MDIIASKGYSAIEDKDLALELIKNYEYPTEEDRASNKHSVFDDVKYFATELHNIGYLKGDPDTFAKDIYAEIDVTTGQ